MTCNCPEPALCARLGRHMHDRLHWLYHNDKTYRAKWEAEAPEEPGKPQRIPLVCTYLDDSHPGESAPTNSPKWKTCTHPDKPLGSAVCQCQGCGPGCFGYSAVQPDRVTVVDKAKLIRSPDKRCFNAGVIDWNGKRLLAYRAGLFGCGRIWLVELVNGQPASEPKKLKLTHQRAAISQDDPRLVVLSGKLYCVFCGVGNEHVARVLMAELDENLNVVRTFEPDYPHSTTHEKNWGLFDHTGKAYVQYTLSPHKILSLDLTNDFCSEAYSTSWRAPTKAFGELRGGSPPVLHDGNYYSFFHGWRHTKDKIANKWYYNVGCVVFKAEPPFNVTRFTPEPIWTAEPASDETYNPPRSVIFPCGAVRESTGWLVSAGHQDTDIHLGYFSDASLDDCLQPV